MKKDLSNFILEVYVDYLASRCESLISSMERPFEKGEVVGLLSALFFFLADEEYSILSAKFDARISSTEMGKGGEK